MFMLEKRSNPKVETEEKKLEDVLEEKLGNVLEEVLKEIKLEELHLKEVALKEFLEDVCFGSGLRVENVL